MLNKQYVMSKDDVEKFKQLKNSALYKDYINTVVTSPVLLNVAKEHISNIDITEDIEAILSEKSYTPKQLNAIFKETIEKTAVSMVAETLILKDIVDVNFKDSVEDLEDNFKVSYLLGLADESFYLKAKAIIGTKDFDTDSLIYKGYAEYLKNKKNGIVKTSTLNVLFKPSKDETEAKTLKTKTKKSQKKIDIDSDDIDF